MLYKASAVVFLLAVSVACSSQSLLGGVQSSTSVKPDKPPILDLISSLTSGTSTSGSLGGEQPGKHICSVPDMEILETCFVSFVRIRLELLLPQKDLITANLHLPKSCIDSIDCIPTKTCEQTFTQTDTMSHQTVYTAEWISRLQDQHHHPNRPQAWHQVKKESGPLKYHRVLYSRLSRHPFQLTGFLNCSQLVEHMKICMHR